MEIKRCIIRLGGEMNIKPRIESTCSELFFISGVETLTLLSGSDKLYRLEKNGKNHNHIFQTYTLL